MASRNVGRFTAYEPDRDPVDIILQILSVYEKGEQFPVKPHEIHQFFHSIKEKSPELFEDIHFTHDPKFPFSKEIDSAFLDIQECGYLTMPNPSENYYMVASDLTSEREKIPPEDMKIIEEISKTFKMAFPSS